jgi:hypothetical protein
MLQKGKCKGSKSQMKLPKTLIPSQGQQKLGKEKIDK